MDFGRSGYLVAGLICFEKKNYAQFSFCKLFLALKKIN